mgnify:CR=1 FL=1
MENVISKVLKKPNATAIVQELNEIIKKEHLKRIAFYDWVEDNQKAEFINGSIIVHSPATKKHLEVSELLSFLIGYYIRKYNLGRCYVEKAMISLTRNDYEPDLVFFSNEKLALIDDNTVLFPAPDFVVEILSKSTQKTDRTIKKEDYALHRIKEYWIIDPDRKIIEQYLLINDKETTYFEPYIYRRGDDISSKVITGFEIPVESIFDYQINMETIKKWI